MVEIPAVRLFDGLFVRITEKWGGDIGRLTRRTPLNSELNKTLRPLLEIIEADEGLTFHSSRHTFATLLVEEGVAVETVSKMLGHQTVATTKIYNEATARGEIERGLIV